MNEGLELPRDEDFDMFLLDYQLDDGNGKELCRQIRQFDSDTPILFFSASHPKIQQDAVECGAQGFVLKPDIEALHDKTSRTLRAINRHFQDKTLNSLEECRPTPAC